MQSSFPSRRVFLNRAALGAAAFAGSSFFLTSGAFAEALVRTPRQTEGPFYPDHLPLDTDNDLLIVNDSITPATGEVTYLSGRILGPAGIEGPYRVHAPDGGLVGIYHDDGSKAIPELILSVPVP